MAGRRIRRRRTSPKSRPSRTRNDALTKAKRSLTRHAKAIDELLRERAEIDRQLAIEQKAAQDLMDEHKIAAHDTKYGRHEYVRARTRATSDVDKPKLIAMLKKKYGAKEGTDKALELASFSVSSVRSEFSTKEADRVVKTKPAPPGDLKYQFLTVDQVAKQSK